MSSLQGHFLFSSKGNLGNDGKKHTMESRVENVKAMSGQQKIFNMRLLGVFFFFFNKKGLLNILISSYVKRRKH